MHAKLTFVAMVTKGFRVSGTLVPYSFTSKIHIMCLAAELRPGPVTVIYSSSIMWLDSSI